ncbi:hypothetical protein [Methylocystis bryophila]|uniref:Uncharacterized protein n=1 Tax=Methylocystis bryophila TaxID=655015 RepID=A0A1W6MZG8_9HYPH|nr:hypothetical protein [Methylocystis bryophila]ARN82987.1 hypothetical protein B1812_20030 [Methylocystis bryophila]BDV39282.1 hypothetical protein DSM21852_25350 [Methylocystis bryophila]
MNTLTNIHATRRCSPGVARVSALAGLVAVRSRVRRTLICAWSVDPATGRLVCTWTRAAQGDPLCLEDAQHPPPFAISLAA